MKARALKRATTTHCIIAFAFMLLVVLLSILRTIVEYTKDGRETDNQNYTYYRSKSARTKRNKAVAMKVIFRGSV